VTQHRIQVGVYLSFRVIRSENKLRLQQQVGSVRQRGIKRKINRIRYIGGRLSVGCAIHVVRVAEPNRIINVKRTIP